MQVAVIGCGKMGKIYAQKLQSLKGAHNHNIEAIYSFDTNATTIEGTQRATTLESITGNSFIDAVVIAASTEAHYELAEKCLRAGKHVLLEKPIALSQKQADKLAKLADEKKCVFMACHQLTENKQFKAILGALKKRSRSSHIREISVYRHYDKPAAVLAARPELAPNEGPHALSLVVEALRATEQLGDITLEFCTNERGATKNHLFSWMRNRDAKSTIPIKLELSDDSQLVGRKQGIELTIQGPGSGGAAGPMSKITWDETVGKIHVETTDEQWTSLKPDLEAIPQDTDPLTTMMDAFLRSVRDPNRAADYPGLAGSTAVGITAIHEGLGKLTGGNITIPAAAFGGKQIGM